MTRARTMLDDVADRIGLGELTSLSEVQKYVEEYQAEVNAKIAATSEALTEMKAVVKRSLAACDRVNAAIDNNIATTAVVLTRIVDAASLAEARGYAQAYLDANPHMPTEGRRH